MEVKTTAAAHTRSVLQLADSITRSRARAGTVLFLAVAATLIAGLWPFHSPANDARWDNTEDAIVFSRQGMVLSRDVPAIPAGSHKGCSLEIWLKPAFTWIRGTPLEIYDHNTRRQFAIMQDDVDLVLRLSQGQSNGSDQQKSLRVEEVFRALDFVLTITSDGQTTKVYVDGVLASTSPEFHLPSKDLAGQMILGSAPLRDQGWAGRIKGLAIYDGELSASEVEKYQGQWRAGHMPVKSSERTIALYGFHERVGKIVHDASGSGIDLEVPERFETVDQLRFESPLSEFQSQKSYFKNAAINVMGFMPLGFTVALFGIACHWKRTTFAAAIIGLATSFVIEYFQSYLPTRFSGVTDLLTNTVGACLGAILCGALVAQLAKEKG
jgi:VanZ family protein